MKEFLIKHADKAAELLCWKLLKYSFKKVQEHIGGPGEVAALIEFKTMLDEYVEAKSEKK